MGAKRGIQKCRESALLQNGTMIQMTRELND